MALQLVYIPVIGTLLEDSREDEELPVSVMCVSRIPLGLTSFVGLGAIVDGIGAVVDDFFPLLLQLRTICLELTTISWVEFSLVVSSWTVSYWHWQVLVDGTSF